jgi:hypothetical protein
VGRQVDQAFVWTSWRRRKVRNMPDILTNIDSGVNSGVKLCRADLSDSGVFEPIEC